MRKLIALALVALAPALMADDGNSATANALASVNLYAPIVLKKVSDVNFGVYVFDGHAVTLKMGQDGTVSGGNKFKGSQLSTDLTLSKAGVFTWSKDENLTVNVKVNDHQLNNDHTILSAPLQLGDKVAWTIEADIDGSATSEAQKLTLYGSLAIGDGALTGSYKGNFSVNVAYN